MNNLKNLINYNNIELYRNNKLILIANNMKDLKDKIKNEINPPSKDIPVFVIQYKIKENTKFPLTIGCSQQKITPDLKLIVESDDKSQIILYTKDDIDKFSLLHLTKIMKAIKNKTIPLTTFTNVTITDVLNSLKILKRTPKRKTTKKK